MVDSQSKGEGAKGVELENTGVGPQEGPTELAQLTQTTPSPALIKENIDALRIMIKEHEQQARAKETPKKLVYDEYEEEISDNLEDLNTPYKRPKPTPFTMRITRFKYHEKAKLPRNVKVYEGGKDLEDHLGIFSSAAEQEE
ncbi:hypothetical protein Tco_0622134 [Tanacetum coccineum]